MKVNTITNKGSQYLQDCFTNNTPLKFSSVKIGCGSVANIDVATALTDVIQMKKLIGIESVLKTENVIEIIVPFNNLGNLSSYKLTEVGIYVLNPDNTETLFWYINYDNEANFINSEDLGIISVKLAYKLLFSNQNITVVNSNSMDIFVSKSYVDSEVGKKLDGSVESTVSEIFKFNKGITIGPNSEVKIDFTENLNITVNGVPFPTTQEIEHVVSRDEEITDPVMESNMRLKMIPERPDIEQKALDIFKKLNMFPFNEIGRVMTDKNTGDIVGWFNDIDTDLDELGFDPSKHDIGVYIPAFYAKRVFDNTTKRNKILYNRVPKTRLYRGYEVPPAFIDVDGSVMDYIIYGAFKGSNVSGQLRSIPFKMPVTNITIGAARTLARFERDLRFNLETLDDVSLLQFLYEVAFQNLNSQAVIGEGWSNKTTVAKTGSTLKLGNRTGYMDPFYESPDKPHNNIKAVLQVNDKGRLVYYNDSTDILPIKIANNKTLDECIVEETPDYIIYSDGEVTADNPIPEGIYFACRVDKHTKEIYTGPGYENYSGNIFDPNFVMSQPAYGELRITNTEHVDGNVVLTFNGTITKTTFFDIGSTGLNLDRTVESKRYFEYLVDWSELKAKLPSSYIATSSGHSIVFDRTGNCDYVGVLDNVLNHPGREGVGFTFLAENCQPVVNAKVIIKKAFITYTYGNKAEPRPYVITKCPEGKLFINKALLNSNYTVFASGNVIEHQPIQEGLYLHLDGRDGNNTDKTSTWKDRTGINVTSLNGILFDETSGWTGTGLKTLDTANHVLVNMTNPTIKAKTFSYKAVVHNKFPFPSYPADKYLVSGHLAVFENCIATYISTNNYLVDPPTSKVPTWNSMITLGEEVFIDLVMNTDTKIVSVYRNGIFMQDIVYDPKPSASAWNFSESSIVNSFKISGPATIHSLKFYDRCLTPQEINKNIEYENHISRVIDSNTTDISGMFVSFKNLYIYSGSLTEAEIELEKSKNIKVLDYITNVNMATASNGNQISLFGIEDFYGNVWIGVDGSVTKDDGIYSTNNPLMYSDISSYVNIIPFTVPTGNTSGTLIEGTTTKITQKNFINYPTHLDVYSNLKYYSDRVWSHVKNTESPIQFGGSYFSGEFAGVFCIYSARALNYSTADSGYRLVFKPRKIREVLPV